MPQLLATLKSGNAQIMSCSETTGWGRAALIWSDPHTSSHHCCSRTNADRASSPAGLRNASAIMRRAGKQRQAGKCMRPPAGHGGEMRVEQEAAICEPPMGTTTGSWPTHRPQHWPWPECVLLRPRCTTRFAIWQTFIWLH